MMQPVPQAIEYLTPHPGSFWKWDRAESAITWKSGQTIAFSLELAQILEPLCSLGLPSFDLVILIIASTRDSWALLGDDPEVDQLLTSYLSTVLSETDECARFAASLDRISLLSSDLRHGVSTKSLLLQSLLAKHPRRCRPEHSRSVVTFLEQCRMLDIEFVPGQVASHDLEFSASDFKLLANRIHQLGDDNLRMLMTSSVEATVEAALLEPLPSANCEARALIQSLLDDDEYRGIGRLSRNLLGVLHRTPKLTHDRSAAIGGVSDISNRGTVDRLLLSELAYDNDTLAVRIANNEAMYLLREPPPRNPSLDRCVLLDSGIRAWGTPRVYAAAIGLALIALAEKHVSVQAWRASGEQVIAVTLQDRDGLVQHLQALTPDLHPGEAIEAFLARAAEFGDGADKYLITTRDAWHDPEFQRFLAVANSEPLCAIVVDREGGLEVIEVTPMGHKTIRTAQMDLSELFPTSTELRTQSTALPQILDISPFPLRLPIQAKCPYLIDESTVVASSYDGRLLIKNSDQFGAIQVRDSAASPIAWAAKWRECVYILLGPALNRNHCLISVDVSDMSVGSNGVPIQPDLITSALSDCSNFRIESNCLVGYSKTGATAISLTGRNIVGTHRWRSQVGHPNFVYQHESSGWNQLQFDGCSFAETTVLALDEAKANRVQYVIERIDRKGFLFLTKVGTILSSADGNSYSLPAFDCNVERIENVHCSANGQWVALECLSPSRSRCILLRLDEHGRVCEASESAIPRARAKITFTT